MSFEYSWKPRNWFLGQFGIFKNRPHDPESFIVSKYEANVLKEQKFEKCVQRPKSDIEF